MRRVRAREGQQELAEHVLALVEEAAEHALVLVEEVAGHVPALAQVRRAERE